MAATGDHYLAIDTKTEAPAIFSAVGRSELSVVPRICAAPHVIRMRCDVERAKPVVSRRNGPGAQL